jgi:hypothetical protein
MLKIEKEHMQLIPDKFERCVTCNNLFDADRESKRVVIFSG